MILKLFQYSMCMRGGILGFLIVCSLLNSAAQNNKIQGRLLVEEDPVSGVIIRVEKLAKGAISDENGRFVLTNMPAGVWTLQFQHIAYQDLELPITLGENDFQDLGNIQLQPKLKLDPVLILGKFEEGSQQRAMLHMIESLSQSFEISAEELRKNADLNPAEALQRLAGVVMDNDRGEGNFISFRGTPPAWNAVWLDGDRLPVANEEIEGRLFNFNMLPINMFEQLSYRQTFQASEEGDAIGGSANLLSREVPLIPKLHISVGSGLNQKAGLLGSRTSILYGNQFANKKVGLVIGASRYARNLATDSYGLFFGANTQHAIERLEFDRYEGNRQNWGAHSKLVFQPKDRFRVYFQSFYGSLVDEAYNRKTLIDWVGEGGQSIDLLNTFGKNRHSIFGGKVGFDWNVHEKIQLEARLSRYTAYFGYEPAMFETGDPRNGRFTTAFEKLVRYNDFLYLDENGQQTDPLNASSRQKLLDIDSPIEGYGDSYDNIQFSYDNIVAVKPEDTLFVFQKAFSETYTHRESDPWVGRIVFGFFPQKGLQCKIGVKYRLKQGERSLTFNTWQRNPFDVEPILNDDFEHFYVKQTAFLQEIGSPYQGKIPAFLSNESINQFVGNLGERLKYLPFSENTPYYKEFIGSTYSYQEEAKSAFLLSEYDEIEDWKFQLGLRVEQTELFVIADSVIENINTNSRFLAETRMDQTYLAILPMLNIKKVFRENNQFRFAASRTFRRPNFNELKPGEPEIHYGHFHILYGNQNLKPSFSWNVDASYQHFWGLEGMISTGIFYKYVTDHIFSSFDTQENQANIPNQFAIPGGLLAKRYENAPFAHVGGLELSLRRRLRNRFQLLLNYSFMASAMKIDAREALQPLPQQARHIANLGLRYEGNRFQIHSFWNYRSPYLVELNLFSVKDPVTGEETIIQQSVDYDRFRGRSLNWDIAIQYRFTEQIAFFLQLNNLLNFPYVIYRGRRERPVLTRYNGQRALLEVRFQLDAGRADYPLPLPGRHQHGPDCQH